MNLVRYTVHDAPGLPGRGSILEGEVVLFIRGDSGGLSRCRSVIAGHASISSVRRPGAGESCKGVNGCMIGSADLIEALLSSVQDQYGLVVDVVGQQEPEDCEVGRSPMGYRSNRLFSAEPRLISR